MKYLLILCCVFSLSFQALYAQFKDETAIRSSLKVQTDAWNAGDIEKFMSTYWKSDSLMFIGKSGITYGWTNTLNNYKKGYPDKDAMGFLSFDILKVSRLSALYFHVIGKWHLKRKEDKGDLGGAFTLLFRKIKGKWVIVCDHSS